MKIKDKKINLNYIGKTVLCIGIGTGLGLIVYGIFLYFKIAVFGWNLGLIFAPLAAGYAETLSANRLIGKNLGAVSAFILFIYTTFYSFILKNPTLGMNIITAGSIVVILQAAFPTVVNYLLLVVLGALASNLRWVIRKLIEWAKKVKYHIRWETTEIEPIIDVVPKYDENESTDMHDRSHDLIGIYQTEVIIENENEISVKREEIENKRLICIKKGKDECLIKLAQKIKENGGNGVLDLNIQYGLIGLGQDNIHITATGMGLNIK
ncbi:MAG: hypothetical protein Q4Q18_05495 [Methanobrevibacter sp.]|nr:hypothetical protein [Methanobrevibacter sp.]